MGTYFISSGLGCLCFMFELLLKNLQILKFVIEIYMADFNNQNQPVVCGDSVCAAVIWTLSLNHFKK